MSLRVLVVDDDPDIRESLSQILAEEGFDVASARNGLEALDEIARGLPDVMLLDLMMPVLTGWEVLETLRLKGLDRQLPVVVLSAVEAEGCADYIQKPIRLPKLLALIDTVRARGTQASASREPKAASPQG
jgi:CheY-like chemotaxis protein